jgi:hypothetical protein
MNTHELGIPSTTRSPEDQLFPAQTLHSSFIIERLAASHAEVLEKWHRNFALDLRPPKVEPLPS